MPLRARHVRDAGAHHSGAEHGDLLRRLRVEPVRTRAAGVDRVQVEPERLDHVLRDLALGEVDEVAALDRERGVDVDVRALDRRAHDVVRCGHRGALELLAQVRRERRQHARQLRAGRRAAGHAVALRVPRLDGLGVRLDPRPRGVEHRLGGVGDLVDQAEPDRVRGVVSLTLQQHLHQPVRETEHAHGAHDAAGARQQAEGDLGEAELRLRVVQRDAVVARRARSRDRRRAQRRSARRRPACRASRAGADRP